ncbi:efflux RND transporter periplasmic adaptor subunit [Oceanobacillus chungangensis]|uniref:HlyD family secretion protein n=1 Tax=Oceanobacillus chungangensis TaxID=1229152 RepID=A0A3D8PTL1_9BACI|nr:efflux RND transporter periplasmic adaptor subunit [Oceanobacillus chungangensis]RDW18621.1 HlyD family secretion protein [Oceanobacillus chungangensis]
MRKRAMQLLIVLFIGANFLLVYLDKEGKVERTAYINEWSESFDADLADKLYTPGVLASASEEQLYFDKNLGSFKDFLIGEGETVSAGTPLYTYEVHNYYESEADLLNEQDKLEEEAAAIELAITEMERYRIPISTTRVPNSFTLTEEELEIEFPESTVDATLLKEQFIVEKEKELAQKNAELTSIENQLTELQTTGDTITVESPFEGRIKSIATTLEDPIITIESADLHAVGELTENERVRIEQGLPVEIMLNEKEAALTGIVETVSESPKKLKIEGESIYPFDITLDEAAEVEGLLPGYHADLAIIIEEALGATTLFQNVIFTDSVWKMAEGGRLVKQPVETGIHMDDMVEITSGISTGEWIAEEPTRQFREDATFITPLKTSPITKESLKVDWARGLITGILSR